MDISTTLKKPVIIPIATGIVAFAGGFVAGYFRGKKHRITFDAVRTVKHEYVINSGQQSLFDYTPEEENVVYVRDETRQLESSTKINYAEINKKEDIDTNEMEMSPVSHVNVFKNDNSSWDWELELNNRRSDAPYIINQDEFCNDEMNFSQDTVTYYEGDDILADSLDTPIYNHTALVGELRFGHGTTDPNVVYIRNEALEMEWEVLRHTGSFAAEVLGLAYEKELEEDIRHANKVQKFRTD